MTTTVRAVSPQPRGIVLPDDAERMIAALSALEDANDELVRVVALALNNGASIREVMKVTGMSNARVQRLGHAGGWPTAEFKAKRAEVRRRNADWEAFMQANPDGPPSVEPEWTHCANCGAATLEPHPIGTCSAPTE